MWTIKTQNSSQMTSLFLSLCLVGVALSSDSAPLVLSLTRDNLTSTLRDGQAYFVFFGAAWCGHCKRLKPVWSEVAAELKGHTVLATVDGDAQLDLVARFGVKGYPTLVHVRSAGAQVRIFSGDRSKAELVKFARGGYAHVEPLSFWQSPLSLVGDAVGLVTRLGLWITQTRDWLLTSGYPFPLVVVFGIGALLLVALALSLLTVCCMSLFEKKHKAE